MQSNCQSLSGIYHMQSNCQSLSGIYHMQSNCQSLSGIYHMLSHIWYTITYPISILYLVYIIYHCLCVRCQIVATVQELP